MDGAGAVLFATLPAYETFGSVFDWSFLLGAGLAGAVERVCEQANTLF
jgi:hypothetical protein